MLKAFILAAAILPGALVAQTAEPAKAKAAADPQRRICRAAVETGSLVKKHKECHTAAEWAQQSRDQNQATRAALDAAASGSRSGQ